MMEKTHWSGFDLSGKVAVVTGGALGIGAAIASRLSEAGAMVAVADVEMQSAYGVVEAIGRAGGRASAFACDVSSVSRINATVEDVVSVFGRIDVLINNAGIFPLAPVLDITEAIWDKVMAVNLRGAFFLAQQCAAQMIKQGSGGSIVNIASIDGLHPSGHLVHYDASKGGLMMMTRSLALELGKHHIRVNTICPGAIQTPGADRAMSVMAGHVHGAPTIREQFAARVPLGRVGQPTDVASAAVFLASSAADYITGSSLVIDGGLLLC